jgi:ectoine hydroxylase-related dioxygenase (phytanoyl-CoA dioxygenase family)
VSPDVTKGSVKHQLGFLYAPKELDDAARRQITPVALRPGQALVFSLSLVHGQEVNRSQVTRIQSDARVVSSFAPIQWTRNVHADYYRPLCSSAVAQQARRYLSANQTDQERAP